MFQIIKVLSALTSLSPALHPEFPLCNVDSSVCTVGPPHHWMGPPVVCVQVMGPGYSCSGCPAWTQEMRQVPAGQDPLAAEVSLCTLSVWSPNLSAGFTPCPSAP